MIESSVDAFHLTDAQARFLRVNAASTRLLGYTRDELLAMTVHDLDPNFPRDAWPARWAELRERGSFTVNSALRRKDGELVPVELTVNYFLFEGEEYSSTVVRDISERLRAEGERAALEQQLLQSQKLEAIGTLTSGIAHNFNNMLTVILGNASLARRNMPGDHPAGRSLDAIEEASARAANLVGQMLTFARRKPATRRRVDLPAALEQAVKWLRNAIPSSIELHTRFDADVPPVLADEARLQQVLINLCNNAWHAYEGCPGGIWVSLSCVDVVPNDVGGEPRGTAYACMTVTDRAKGMDEATRARVFEPFFTTKEIGQGTGLGLSVVHGIVQQHGGTIQVASEPGQGTTFRVYLPALALEEQPDVAQPPVLGAPLRGLRLLHIDDEPLVGSVVSELLSAEGHHVTTFSDPAQALAAIERASQGYDVVITDLHMARLSGLDVVARVAALRPGLPVLVVSGDVSDGTIARLLAAGALGVLPKPWPAGGLEAALAGLVHPRRD